jgi:hypothetical protein
MMLTDVEKKAQLAILDAAILTIATGGQKVLIRSGEKTVQYGPGSLAALQELRNGLLCRPRRLIYMTPVG